MNDNIFEGASSGPCSPLSLSREDAGGTDAELAALAKAIAHPVRLQIIRILSQRTTCVCGEIVDELPFAQSTVSEHLRILKEAGLIRGEIAGTRVCYYLETAALDHLKALISAL